MPRFAPASENRQSAHHERSLSSPTKVYEYYGPRTDHEDTSARHADRFPLRMRVWSSGVVLPTLFGFGFRVVEGGVAVSGQWPGRHRHRFWLCGRELSGGIQRCACSPLPLPLLLPWNRDLRPEIILKYYYCHCPRWKEEGKKREGR